MKIAYFDCFAGISGDMTVGALIDLGVDPQWLAGELRKLPLNGYRLQVEKVDKNGIQAVQFSVILEHEDGERPADAEFFEVDSVDAGVATPEETAGRQDQNDHGEHGDFVGHGVHKHPHRSLEDILELIRSSQLSDNVKDLVGRIFTRLGEAESQVHGVPLQQVHFHEVGGVDAIIDITAAVIAVEYLGIEAIQASPLHLGSGFVHTQHGLLPIPAPATAKILEGVPAYSGQARGELVTPTGAAIITTLAEAYGPLPLMTIHRVGYGAGQRKREFPNALRVFLGETTLHTPSGWSSTSKRDRTANDNLKRRDPYPEQHDAPVGPGGYHESPGLVIEAAIDDMEPELFESLTEKLLQAGALDALLIPVQMKKSRPGMLLHVLAYPSSLDELLQIIFRESTSIGVRTYPVTKRMLQRQVTMVETPFGPVNVKVAWLGEEMVNIKPEYEDCRALADQHQRPLKDVLAAAHQAAWQAIQTGQFSEKKDLRR
jgi:uncharacterized protein (TIGR00299 family) protein